MLQIRNLSNALQKRLIRGLYAQSQATPYAAVLHATLRNADGSIHVPVVENLTASGGLNYTVATFSLQSGLVPGTVMVKGPGDSVVPSSGAATASPNTLVPFGLLANFVGGTLDDLKDNNEVGVWRGPDAVFELLWPAFNATGLAAAYAAATPGVPVPLYTAGNSQLGAVAATIGATATNQPLVANLIEYNPARIVIDLKV